MSKIEVDTIDTQSSTTLQVGSTNTSLIKIGTSGDTVEYPAGTTFTQSGTQNVTAGGAITVKSGGNITIDSGATITNNGTATGFSADLTNLNATNLTSGTVPDARFPATLPIASGSALTNLNATNLGSGTVPDARFPATLPAISGANLTNLPASGSMVKLGETNVTSATASVTFDGLFSSTYPNYKLMITDLVSASAEQARLRVMIGGSESTSNEYYSGHVSVQASAAGGSLDGSRIWPATSFQLLNHSVSTATRQVSMFYIDIPNPLYASSNPTFSQRHMVNEGNSSMIVAGTGGYFYYDQTAISGVKFFMNSGNINYGNFYLYGIKD